MIKMAKGDHHPLDPNKFRREFKGKQPIPASSMRGQGFGRPDLDRSFFVERSFHQAAFFVLKYEWLDATDREALCNARLHYKYLAATIEHFRYHDFSQIAEHTKDYANQQQIPKERIDNFVSCLIYYDMDMGSVIRYTSGNYLASHRDKETILPRLKGIVPANVYADCERLLTSGAPAKLQGEMSYKNVEEYRQYGNHKSIDLNLVKVKTTMNKEERNCFVIPLYWWLTQFIINCKTTPQGYLIKPNKNDRLIFDGAHRPHPWSVAINDLTDKANEPELIFGEAFVKNLIRIYNLRITYPR